MFRVVANCASVGIRLRAVSLPRFSERSARMRERRAANPRDEKNGPSRVLSQLRGHFRVSRVSLDSLAKMRLLEV